MKKLVLILILFSYSFSYSQTIHLIIFANTNDPKIGKSCEVDKEAVSLNIKTVARVLKYKLEMKVFDGSDFTQVNLKSTINSLQCSNNDIVFFYFSGHGGRSKNDESEWPQINFNKEGQNVDDYYVPLFVVNNIIKQQDPRLSIVIGDCCNNYANISPKIEMKGLTVVEDEEVPNAVFSKLFRNVKGDILVSSSKQGEYSYSDPEKGGFFTANYLKSFAKALNKEIPTDWISILNTTKELTAKEINNASTKTPQTPQYEVNVEYIDNPTPTPPVNIETSYMDDINNLLDKSISSAQRMQLAKEITQKYFTNNAKVYTIAKNAKTVIDSETVLKFLYRLVYNKRILNVVEIDKKETRQKIRVLYVHEIRKKL